jgi:hypothetical protein
MYTFENCSSMGKGDAALVQEKEVKKPFGG